MESFISLVRSDLHRTHGSVSLGAFFHHFFFTPGFKLIFYFRLCKALSGKRFLWPVSILARFLYWRSQIRYGIGIPLSVKIGPGFRILHYNCIFIHEDVVIGKNCTISQGVSLGHTLRGKSKGAPRIGDRVYIAPGAKIFGKISIGNDVAVGANSVVTHDVPDLSVVVGIPGHVISDKGSFGYITKTDY